MANSRIMLTCKHCGEQMVIGKGYLGSYFSRNEQMHKHINEFYEKHQMGECSDDIDCSDEARNHFVILEEGETLEDVADVVEVVRCKDCRWWKPMDNGFSWNNEGRTDGACQVLYSNHHAEMALTEREHFCSYGERKERV